MSTCYKDRYKDCRACGLIKRLRGALTFLFKGRLPKDIEFQIFNSKVDVNTQYLRKEALKLAERTASGGGARLLQEASFLESYILYGYVPKSTTSKSKGSSSSGSKSTKSTSKSSKSK